LLETPLAKQTHIISMANAQPSCGMIRLIGIVFLSWIGMMLSSGSLHGFLPNVNDDDAITFTVIRSSMEQQEEAQGEHEKARSLIRKDVTAVHNNVNMMQNQSQTKKDDVIISDRGAQIEEVTRKFNNETQVKDVTPVAARSSSPGTTDPVVVIPTASHHASQPPPPSSIIFPSLTSNNDSMYGTTARTTTTPSAAGIKGKNNRTLVILWGTVRGAEPIWKSLYRHLLDFNNNTDLALMVSATKEYANSSLYGRATYIWDFQEYEDWSMAIDTLFGTSPDDDPSWRHIARRTKNGPFGGTKEDPRSSGAIRGLMHMWVGQRVESLGLLDEYDRFVMTRTDVFYAVDLDLASLDQSKIWIPQGENFGGVYDRFYICPNHIFLKALYTHPPAIQNPQKYYSFEKRLKRYRNIESFIRLRWQEEGIYEKVRLFRRVLYIGTVQGDDSRWAGAVGEAFVEDGISVFYKYQGEYDLTMKTLDWVETKGEYFSLALPDLPPP
jgi:hypothetical protein